MLESQTLIQILYPSLWGVLFSFLASGSQSFCERTLNAWYRKSRKSIPDKWEYVLQPRSFCDSCSTQIRTIYLFPIFGALLSKGVCPTCQKPIPKKYSYTEVFAFFYGTSLAVLFHDPWFLVVSAIYFFLLIIIISVDFEFFLIPLESIFLFMIVALADLYYSTMQLLTLQIAFIWLILLYLLYMFRTKKLGLADVYLIFAMSLAIGFPHSLYLPALAAITGIVVVLLNFSKSKQKLVDVKVPFGVYLGVSFLILRLIPKELVF